VLPRLLQFREVLRRLMPPLVGVPGRRGARRPDGTFAEALFAVPPSGAGPPAAAADRHGVYDPSRLQVEDALALAGLKYRLASNH
jgi:hypothetical protein